MNIKNWIAHHLAEVKDTLVPENPDDSYSQKLVKRLGWIMFLILMLCATIVMLTAMSFAH